MATHNSTKAAQPKHEKKNLIFLVWPVNTCYSHLQTQVPKGVSLDLLKGTWTFRDRSFPIGRSVYYDFMGQSGAPIGCYDRTRLKDLQEFKNACEWVQTRNGPAISVD